jgi:putative transposase
MDKYQNKYRIPSARAAFWNYGWNAAYFVTICTQNRIGWFGNVVNGEMVLSAIGQIAHQCWMEIPEHFPILKLDSFIVMPNHVHGIIIIDKPENDSNKDTNVGSNVETQNFASLQQQTGTKTENKFGPQSQNLASIIRGFKIGVTKNARIIQPDFAWQSRYHDHIIRNDESYHTISDYIINNPAKWTDDKFYIK